MEKTVSQEYLPDIDGLRAVAVIAVMVGHFLPGLLPSGYLGVDVFFVISGFVITRSLLNYTSLSTSDYLAGFYLRRIKRLAPALIVTVVVGIFLVRLFDPLPTDSTLTGAASVFGLANIFLYFRQIDYFGQSADLNIFTHMWSLGVEEQFYVVYPLLLIFLAAKPKLLFRLIIVLSLVSGISFLAVHSVNQPAAYFLMPFRFWELGLGAALGLVSDESIKRLRSTASLAFLSKRVNLLVISLVAALLIPESMPRISTVLVTALTGLVILGIISSQENQKTVLGHRVSIYLGKISYSMYLWHWIVLCISIWTIGVFWWTVPFQFAMSLGLGALSYRFIERPTRHVDWFPKALNTYFAAWPIARQLLFGVSIMLLTSFAPIVFMKLGFPQFSGEHNNAALDYTKDVHTGRFTGRNPLDCNANKVVKQGEAVVFGDCTLMVGASIDVLMLGDSHSADLFPVAEEMGRNGVANVTSLHQPGCQIPPLPHRAHDCKFLATAIRAFAEISDRPKVIVIRNNYSPRNIDGTLASYKIDLTELIGLAHEHGMQIVYFAPAPKFKSIGPKSLCSHQWFRPSYVIEKNCVESLYTGRTEQLNRRRDFFLLLEDLQKSYNNFSIFDPFSILCGEEESLCIASRDGLQTYRDDNHLTYHGSMLLAEPFSKHIRTQVLTPAP